MVHSRGVAALLLVGCSGGPGTIGDDAATGDSLPSDGDITAQDFGNAGNPDGTCTAGLPPRGMPADTSHPTTVIGNGTPASCTFDKLKTAVTTGGIITFDCGPAVVTIAVTATLTLPTTKNTVIDGGKKIVLDGGNTVQILRFDSANFQDNENGLTLQYIALTNGKMTGTMPFPAHPEPCSGGFFDGEGGALYMRDGNLNVIGSIFTGNHAEALGPDTGGGAIYVVGSKHGMVVATSTFSNNGASNAGAVGGLFCELNIYNSLFKDNVAEGHGANYDDVNKCPFVNNDTQHEAGSGGNGAAIYSDGAALNVNLCGDKVASNAAGSAAFGGGLFFTSNDFDQGTGGNLTITDTTMIANTGGHWTSVHTGGTTDAGSAVATNTNSITIVNSMLQGVP